MAWMFDKMYNLETIYVSNKFVTNSVTTGNQMFEGDTLLTGANGTKYDKKNMTYKGCAELIMPRNYIVNNHYSQLGRDEIESRIIKTCKYLPLVANTIQN